MNDAESEFDVAVRELGLLFQRANRVGIQPHLLDPDGFYRWWHVLNSQPLPVAKEVLAWLLSLITNPRLKIYGSDVDENDRSS